MDVSIIIVNYKTPKLLLDCIRSIYHFTKDVSFEIIVVDNNSEDNSKSTILREFLDVNWIDMEYNAGFGRANNKGIDVAKGRYTLLLNSDVELYEDAISLTLDHYKSLELKQKVGLVGCQIKHKNGKLQPSCNYYWAGLREVIEEHPIGIKILQHWLRIKKLRSRDKYLNLSVNHKITWLGVPFALIDSEIIKSFKFDEDFFLYSEDEELNFRLSKNGYSSFFFSGAGVYHHIGASSENNNKRDLQIFYSKLQFVKKAYGSLYFWIYCKLLTSCFKWNSKLDSTGSKFYKIEEMNNYIDERGMLNVYKNFRD